MALDLQLDPAIRSWVLLPIFVAMFLISLLRHYANKLMRTDTKVDVKALREAQAVTRSQRLRNGANFLPHGALAARKQYFCAKETGVFQQKSEKLTPQQQMLSDPSAMTGMMKNNLGMMMLTMAWVNFFFSGFVVAKVPFPLTQRFRAMLQRGVDLQSLDVTYVSSLSWYFLNVFGLNGLLSLVLGEATTVNDAAMMQQQQAAMMMGVDTSKAYVAEREALEGMHHDWAMHKVELDCKQTLKRLVQL